MDRKEEIIRLQMDVINQMTQTNLKRIADDLWGVPTLQSGGIPAVREGTDPFETPAKPLMPTQAATADTKEAQTTQQQEDPPESIDDLKKELEGYIGLNVIKKEVQSSSTW